MLNEQKTYTGTSYTITAALLMVAFIFSPAVLFVSRRGVDVDEGSCEGNEL